MKVICCYCQRLIRDVPNGPEDMGDTSRWDTPALPGRLQYITPDRHSIVSPERAAAIDKELHRPRLGVGEVKDGGAACGGAEDPDLRRAPGRNLNDPEWLEPTRLAVGARH